MLSEDEKVSWWASRYDNLPHWASPVKKILLARSSQLSSTRGKLFASRNIKCPRTNIRAYFRILEVFFATNLTFENEYTKDHVLDFYYSPVIQSRDEFRQLTCMRKYLMLAPSSSQSQKQREAWYRNSSTWRSRAARSYSELAR